MQEASVDLTVDGERHSLRVHPQTPLALVLRNDVGRYSVRLGCGIGECGSCAVLVDGRLERSCSIPVSEVAGRSITTPEGLGSGAVHPVQDRFLCGQAGQCGYCINGFIVAAVAAGHSGAPGDGASVPLEGHYCRCGTHVRILDAVGRTEHDAVQGRPGTTPTATHRGDGEVRRLARAQEVHRTGDRPGEDVEKHRVESWIRLTDDGRVEVNTGKVEIGQGIRTALAQIAAAQLGLPLDLVDVRSTQTTVSPDELYTAGSMSVEDSGLAVARSAVAFRRLLLERAAVMLGTAGPEGLTLDASGVSARDGATVPLAALAQHGPLLGEFGPDVQPDWSAAPIGQAVPREDLVSKLTGAPTYLHDMALEGMVHARAVLPPNWRSRLEAVDAAPVRTMPGVLDVVVDGSLVVVIADREDAAARAVTRLEGLTQWSEEDLGCTSETLFERLRELQPEDREIDAEDAAIGDGDTGSISAVYQQPYHAHASIAPSCAIGLLDGEQYTVWTHSQGVYPLRGSLSRMLDVEVQSLTVQHVDGPGCYGHNLADDAAAFAAVAARAMPGVPVRFIFSAEDEFAWEPYGSAMEVRISAGLSSDGDVEDWVHAVLTDTHNTRPDGTPDRLVPSWLIEGGKQLEWPGAGFGRGGTRNALPLYSFPRVTAYADHVRGPLRTSALRTLGAFANVFASESFMDELAEAAEVDPLEFRLRHLTDPRATEVLTRVAELAGWEPRVGPSGRGLGLAVSRYKNSKAYVAIAARVVFDEASLTVEVPEIHMVADAGVVVNPDGVLNQLEGGVIQGLSRALCEEVVFDRRGVRSRDLTTYRVLGLSRTPRIVTRLVDRPDAPPLGVGEASLGPAAAALANAIDDATGVRLRRMPFTGEQIERRLLSLDEREMSRVVIA
jgi:nicotinate dehydrogenase subunit B